MLMGVLDKGGCGNAAADLRIINFSKFFLFLTFWEAI